MAAPNQKIEVQAPLRPYGAYAGYARDSLFLVGSGYIFATRHMVAQLNSRFFADVALALDSSAIELTVGCQTESYRAVATRPGTQKSVNAPDVRILSFHVNPDHRLFRAFRLLPEPGVLKLDRTHFDFLNADMEAAFTGRLSIARALQLHRQVLDIVARRLPTVEPLDPRVVRILEHIARGSNSSLEYLAATVHLSYKRASLLFAQNVGLPLKSYLLWRKLQRYEILAGKYGRRRSITEIAHAAGFVDSAHLCRTFQEVFSAPPSYFFANEDVRVKSWLHDDSIGALPDFARTVANLETRVSAPSVMQIPRRNELQL